MDESKNKYNFYTSKLLDELENKVIYLLPDSENRIQISAEFDKFRFKLTRQTFQDTPIFINLEMLEEGRASFIIHFLDFNYSYLSSGSRLEHYELLLGILEGLFDEVKFKNPEVENNLILVMGEKFYRAITSLRLPIIAPHCLLAPNDLNIEYICFIFDKKSNEILKEIQGVNILI